VFFDDNEDSQDYLEGYLYMLEHQGEVNWYPQEVRSSWQAGVNDAYHDMKKMTHQEIMALADQIDRELTEDDIPF
jgi:DnaJ-domain-containing protein 1